jgi:uncharacterized membrane protein YeaQ/YmgE (transglycosylase-associated protein family)
MKIPTMQPSTVVGIGDAVTVIVGTIAGVIAHQVNHDPQTLAIAAASAGVIAGAILKVWLPDNTAAQGDANKLVTDAVMAATNKNLTAALPLLVQDAVAALGAVTNPATVVTATAAVTPHAFSQATTGATT